MLLRNATLEDHTFRTGGGASILGVTLGATVVIEAAIDYWPDPLVQRTVCVGGNGNLYKDADGVAGSWVTLTGSALPTGTSRVPFLYRAGQAAAAQNAIIVYCDRINRVRVLSGDGVTVSVITAPPADWSGSDNSVNQPGCGAIHQGYNWMAGNRNASHTVYRSLQADHQDFTTTAYSLRVFPGVGEYISAMLTYKGVLLIWKYPEGVFAVDTSDASDTNWRVIKVGSAGAPGPKCVVQIEDDVLWVAPDGSWHLVSATTATGSVRAEDLAARKLGSFARDQINLNRLQWADLIYYAHKQEVQLGCSASGQSTKTRRLHLDLARRTEIGERWIWWDRDANETLFIRKLLGVFIPAMGDTVGRIWEMDRINRNANNAAYTFEWWVRDTDFAEIIPGWQGKYKNLRFIQLEYDGRSAATHTVEVYRDGTLGQSALSLSLSAGSALPRDLPFTLGTESLRLTQRRRLRGRAIRTAVRGYTTAINADVSIAKILIGLEIGE